MGCEQAVAGAGMERGRENVIERLTARRGVRIHEA